jgi:hypothetical protein
LDESLCTDYIHQLWFWQGMDVPVTRNHSHPNALSQAVPAVKRTFGLLSLHRQHCARFAKLLLHPRWSPNFWHVNGGMALGLRLILHPHLTLAGL